MNAVKENGRKGSRASAFEKARFGEGNEIRDAASPAGSMTKGAFPGSSTRPRSIDFEKTHAKRSSKALIFTHLDLFFLASALFLLLVVRPILTLSMSATGMLAMKAQMMVWLQ